MSLSRQEFEAIILGVSGELGVKQRDRVAAPQQRKCLLVSDPKGCFVDEYIKGKKSVAFRYRNGSEHATQYGFSVTGLNNAGREGEHSVISQRGHSVESWPGEQQTFMLPYDVEVMEEPQRLVPSVVRFERFDGGSLFVRKPLFSFFVIDPQYWIDHGEFASEDWKMPIAIRSFAVALGEGARNEIEGASQRVNDRPDPSIERQGKRLFLNSYNQIIARLRVSLTHLAIGASLSPFVEGLLEQWDLGYGPVDSGLSA